MENYEKMSREELKKLHAEIETRLDDIESDLDDLYETATRMEREKDTLEIKKDDIEEILTQMDRDEANHEAAEAEADAATENAKLVNLLRKRYGKAGDWPANISDYWRK